MSEPVRKGSRVDVAGHGHGRVVGFITEQRGYPGRRFRIVIVRLDHDGRYRECGGNEITVVEDDAE